MLAAAAKSAAKEGFNPRKARKDGKANSNMRNRFRFPLAGLAMAMALAAPAASAQDIVAAGAAEQFIINSAASLFGSFAVLAAICAFALRDIGLAQVQNAPAVGLRTLGALGAGLLGYWLLGAGLMSTVEPGGLLGEFGVLEPVDDGPAEAGRAAATPWLFYLTLSVLGSVIVSGAISERVKLWPFCVFAGANAAIIFPIAAGWAWGGGYLADVWRFVDFAGAGVVHIVAGAAALAAAIVVGPRPGRFNEIAPRPTQTTAVPLSLVGSAFYIVFMIAAFAGFSGDVASLEGAISLSTRSANAIVAAFCGGLIALFLTKMVYQRAGLVTGMTGLIAGLVSIAADPLHPAFWQAAMIGAVGGVIATVAPPFLERTRIDDAGFVVPAHLLCGLWGVAIVPWTNTDAWFPGQLIGAAMLTGFGFVMSLLWWAALRYTAGVRHTNVDDRNDANS